MDEARCRMADEKLGAAIGSAMQRLPDRMVIRLNISRGACTVSVTAKNGRRVWFDGEIAQAVNDAVEWLENEG